MPTPPTPRRCGPPGPDLLRIALAALARGPSITLPASRRPLGIGYLANVPGALPCPIRRALGGGTVAPTLPVEQPLTRLAAWPPTPNPAIGPTLIYRERRLRPITHRLDALAALAALDLNDHPLPLLLRISEETYSAASAAADAPSLPRHDHPTLGYVPRRRIADLHSHKIGTRREPLRMTQNRRRRNDELAPRLGHRLGLPHPPGQLSKYRPSPFAGLPPHSVPALEDHLRLRLAPAGEAGEPLSTSVVVLLEQANRAREVPLVDRRGDPVI